MNAATSDQAEMSRSAWCPAKAQDLEIGPPRWDGSRMLCDVSRAGQSRLLTIGLRERVILDEVDGNRDVDGVLAALHEQGTPIAIGALLTTLNQMVVLGLLIRPFKVNTPGTEAADASASQTPGRLPEVVVTASGGHEPWRRLGWLGSNAGMITIAVMAATALVGVVAAFGPAFTVVTSGRRGWWILGLFALAMSWNMLVTLVHEGAHAAVFAQACRRQPRIAIVRFGIIPMANTQLPGLSLLPKRTGCRVVVIGPLVSLCLAAIPAIGVLVTPSESILHDLSAICLLVDMVVIALGISFFPNTDGTRLVEILGSVDQIQRVAIGTLLRRMRLPKALPLATRLAVRIYPILLLGSLLALLGVSALAFLLATP